MFWVILVLLSLVWDPIFVVILAVYILDCTYFLSFSFLWLLGSPARFLFFSFVGRFWLGVLFFLRMAHFLLVFLFGV